MPILEVLSTYNIALEECDPVCLHVIEMMQKFRKTLKYLMYSTKANYIEDCNIITSVIWVLHFYSFFGYKNQTLCRVGPLLAVIWFRCYIQIWVCD